MSADAATTNIRTVSAIMPISSRLTAVLLTRWVALVETPTRSACMSMISAVTTQQLSAVPS